MRLGWRVVATAGAALVTLGGAVIVGLASTDWPDRDDAFVIESFDREVVIAPDGTVDVVETIDVRFLESRRGIFRDLPFSGPATGSVAYSFQAVDRGDPASPWPVARESIPGSVRLRIGDADVWLDPGDYRYRLVYSIDGLLYASEDVDGDGTSAVEARIDVPGGAWPTDVEATTLRVTGPADVMSVACVRGRAGSIDPCPASPTVDGDQVTIEVGAMAPSETATVGIRFPQEAFATVLPGPRDGLEPLGTPDEDGGWLSQLEPIPAALILAAIFAIPFLLLIALRIFVVYRDQRTDPALHDRQHPTAVPAPPRGMRPPEVAGLLLRLETNGLFLSTLVDLDQRGVIQASQWDDGESLTVTTGPDPLSASPREAELLHELELTTKPLVFDGKYDSSTSSRVSSARLELAKRARAVFEENGLLHDRGAWMRSAGFRALQFFAVLVFLWLIGRLFVASTPLAWPAVAVVAALVIIGVVLGLLPWRHHRLPLNSEGRDLVAQARSFREYVATVEAEQLEWAAGKPGIDHLHPAVSLLPYAIVLGLADSWYQRFEGVMQELATRAPAAAGGAAAAGTAWWVHQRSFDSASSAQRSTTTAPSSSSGGGGGGASSGGGGGGGGSW